MSSDFNEEERRLTSAELMREVSTRISRHLLPLFNEKVQISLIFFRADDYENMMHVSTGNDKSQSIRAMQFCVEQFNRMDANIENVTVRVDNDGRSHMEIQENIAGGITDARLKS